MNDDRQDFDDIEYVLRRITWYAKLSVDELKKHLSEQPMDFFYRIKWFDGHERTIGKAAWERILAIAGRYLAKHPDLKRRTTSHHLAEAFKRELEKLIQSKSAELPPEKLKEMLSQAHLAVDAQFKQLQHFIPCSLFLAEKVKRLRVGPVEFVERETFFAEHADKFTELKGRYQADALNTAENAKRYGDALENRIRQYFEEFGWVAVVEIPPAQKDISYERATFLAMSALNIIRLCLGRPYTYRMRTAEERGRDQHSAKLCCSPTGVLEATYSSGGNDHVQGDAYCRLLEDERDPTFENGKKALSAFAGFEEAPPLCVRFIEALAWYGDAVNEKPAAPRIVKLMNAVETLVGTGREFDDKGKQLGVTNIVITRATLLYRAATGTDAKAARDLIDKLYQWRSDLVHGSLSPFEDTLPAKSHETEEAVRAILIRGLHEFNQLGLEGKQFTPSELAKRFHAWKARADDWDKQNPSSRNSP